MRMHNPPHAGLVLREYIDGHSVTEVAERLGITRANLSRILNGRQSITAEMSVRLHYLLGTNPNFWLDMQKKYDLWQAEHNSNIDYSAIKPITRPQIAYV
ncbi:HigA family addiction module antitoxin [Moraxella nasovis]|uniref:HigA family addiction module antitoxin n=1 Tax=Moraxella nasovis TaxID=2904121 RepID=UPI001F61D98E|nr:HigA family addiction module antitoxin [Moraxella nasovis]UNU74099.1 HigA family addiction module antitoxin [Moraxella nasovis]